MPVNVKLSEELVAEARKAGAVHHRSLSEQIERWSRMGKAAEENPDLPFSLVKDILAARREGAVEEYRFG